MNLEILATINGFAEIGMDPSIMGYAPYLAVSKLVEKTKIDLNSVDRFELNEAFAAQSLAVIRDLNIDANKVNVNGGAISPGHPIGASEHVLWLHLSMKCFDPTQNAVLHHYVLVVEWALRCLLDR
ncbi:hypothetical protein MGH68_00575 [Erysipelothrix sp. D19-032]